MHLAVAKKPAMQVDESSDFGERMAGWVNSTAGN